MNGPESAAKRVADWLTFTVGDRDWLDRSAARQGVTVDELAAGALPTPALILPYDKGPLALEEYPAVLVSMKRMVSSKPLETRADGSRDWWTTYETDILTLVRTHDYGTVDLARKRTTLAVREALLSRVQLAPAATYGSGDWGRLGEHVAVVPGTVVEDYSGYLTPEGGDVVAGTITTCQIVVLETFLAVEPLGVAETIELTVTGDTADVRPVWSP